MLTAFSLTPELLLRFLVDAPCCKTLEFPLDLNWVHEVQREHERSGAPCPDAGGAKNREEGVAGGMWLLAGESHVHGSDHTFWR